MAYICRSIMISLIIIVLMFTGYGYGPSLYSELVMKDSLRSISTKRSEDTTGLLERKFADAYAIGPDDILLFMEPLLEEHARESMMESFFYLSPYRREGIYSSFSITLNRRATIEVSGGIEKKIVDTMTIDVPGGSTFTTHIDRNFVSWKSGLSIISMGYVKSGQAYHYIFLGSVGIA